MSMGRGYGRGYGRFGGVSWTQGYSSWTTDYPRADRHFIQALRRLTRVHARSVEQPVNLDDGDQSMIGRGSTPSKWATGI